MSAGRIKGITVEIGGDTTKLSKALEGVNKNIKDTQSQLKDVEKLLKLDPSNTELLAQKQRLLTDAVSETKDKLGVLKTAAEQANSALANGEITQSQYDGLQREIAETERSLRELETAANDSRSAVEKLADTGDKLRTLGGKISDIGGQITKNVTVPIAGAAAASVAAWKEVDEAMDTIVTKTGASGDALADMQKRAQDIAQTIPTSFQTAAEAVGEVNTRFGLTGDALEDTAKRFVEFSEMNGTDVSGSIDKVQTAMAAFGLSAEDTGNMLDILNKAGQDTGISMDTLTTLMASNAAGLKEMGYNAADSAMLLAELSKNGVDTSAAMTGLKKAYANSLKDGTSLNETLSDLEDRLKNADTYTDAAAEAIELFGAKAGGALVDAVSEGRLSFDELGFSMNDFAGNVESTFNETLNPLDQMKTTLNTLKSIGADLVNTAGPMITQLMQGFSDMVRNLSSAWQGLSEEQQQNIIKFAGIAAAIGPVLTVIGKVVSAVGTAMAWFPKIQTAITTVKTALSGLNIAGLLTNPITIVIAAIAALVAAFMHLWQTNEDFRNTITAIWNEIVDTIKGFTQGISDRLSSLGVDFSDIANVIKSIWDGLCNVLAPVFEGAFQAISNVLSFVCDSLLSILDIFIGIFTGNWEQVWESIKSYFSAVWNFIVDSFKNILDTIKGVLDAFLEPFGTSWNEVWTGIKNTFLNIWENIRSAFSSLTNFFYDIWNGIKTTMGNIVDSIKTGFENAITFITSLPQKALQWGKDIITGIVDGIKSCIDNIGNAAGEIADKISSYLHFSVPDKGPLSDYEKWMPDFMKGLAEGIRQSRNLISSAINDVALDMEVSPQIGELDEMKTGGRSENYNDKFDRMINEIDRLGTGLSQMKIVMDSGALVGQLAGGINSNLGRSTSMGRRGV